MYEDDARRVEQIRGMLQRIPITSDHDSTPVEFELVDPDASSQALTAWLIQVRSQLGKEFPPNEFSVALCLGFRVVPEITATIRKL